MAERHVPLWVAAPVRDLLDYAVAHLVWDSIAHALASAAQTHGWHPDCLEALYVEQRTGILREFGDPPDNWLAETAGELRKAEPISIVEAWQKSGPDVPCLVFVEWLLGDEWFRRKLAREQSILRRSCSSCRNSRESLLMLKALKAVFRQLAKGVRLATTAGTQKRARQSAVRPSR